MRKKFEEDSENEFEVDEPEELQENSDDEWAPAKTSNKRSAPKRGNSSKKKKRSSDEEEDEDEPKKKKSSKAKTPSKGKPKKGKVKDEEDEDDDLNEEEVEDEELDDEEVDEEEEEEEETTNEDNMKLPKEFSSGAFVVLKSDFNNTDDPPIWKIDGKSLLQKYVPYEKDGHTFYKNTHVYSGWAINNKDQYYPASVIFKQQTRKDHVVEFQRDLIQKEDIPVAE